ncbi:MAG: hemolysin [Solirubrobacterales bacterium]|jgi:hemolysin III|nr:hemolysin [Solirubrobacterales bacterium]
MAERARKLRKDAGEAMGAVRDGASDMAAAARDGAADAIARVKPRLRGVLHQWAFFASLVAGGLLVAFAPTPRATVATAIYAASLSALLGVSALYHRVNWRRPEVRRWVRRLDHSMIFFLMAGTYTPFALLVLKGTLAQAILVVVWAGAIAGTIVEMIWIDAPKWVTALIYMSLGWVGVVAFPGLLEHAGVAAVALIAAGGLIYSAGALVYATQRPDPSPAVFGYHEVFHLLVIAAASLHFAAIAAYALPKG